jgi:hypothetical protein
MDQRRAGSGGDGAPATDTPGGISRRDALKAGAAVVSAAVAVAALAKAAVAAVEPAAGRIHAYKDYGWLRGLNCIPSWGARIEEAWWSYDADRFRQEMALAKQIHSNCIRLWIEYSAWMADPEKVVANFQDAVAAVAQAGMKVMPCLFNRWHDRGGWDYGGTYVDDLDGSWAGRVTYLKQMVLPLAKDDRVLAWDLCNEPQGGPQREYEWLKAMAATVRECGIQQPLTIGTMTGSNIEVHAPLVDVLCGHPYARDRAGLEKLIAQFRALADKTGKPFLVNECVPGCLDDAKRAQAARFYAEMLSQAGMGWMGWSIREGKAVATRRDRIDGNGIDNQGFHAWFTARGKLRECLEFLKDDPKLQVPWEAKAS